ncbi:MAG: hypothetical protein H0T76_06295 [Nannocystis sp.]|nr:hypothetical protein [Nannocystis sp.]MBA3546072.1 hypothetical protein [Nannocystis sp.]
MELTPDGAPVIASGVEAKSEKTAEELLAEKVKQEVHGRIARRKALRQAGADIEPSSADLAAKLDRGLAARERQVQSNHRARGAVSRSTVKNAVASKTRRDDA